MCRAKIGVPGEDRIAAAIAASLAVAMLGACSLAAANPALQHGIRDRQRKRDEVQHRQVRPEEWYRTIDIGGDFAGAKVVVDERAEPAFAESVHIRNLGGFTGMYSRGGQGDADTSLSGDRFTISGTAHGYKADKPDEPATATFKIVTTC